MPPLFFAGKCNEKNPSLGGVFLRFLKPVNAFFIDDDLVMSFRGGSCQRGDRGFVKKTQKRTRYAPSPRRKKNPILNTRDRDFRG